MKRLLSIDVSRAKNETGIYNFVYYYNINGHKTEYEKFLLIIIVNCENAVRRKKKNFY